MSFHKVTCFTAAIIFGCCCSVSLSEDQGIVMEDCQAKCQEGQQEAIKNGDLVCVEGKWKNGQDIQEPTNKCGLECMGLQPAQDQNGCFAKFCKSHGMNSENFCTAPGAGGIRKDECDSLVGTGKAKLFNEDICRKKH